jgi:ribosomal subunit interface protein
MELIQVYSPNLKLTEDIRKHIRQELQNLKKFYDGRLASMIRVEVGKISGHHQKGKVYRAEINLPAFGRLLRAEEVAESIQTAINIVKEEIERQIKKFKEKRNLH